MHQIRFRLGLRPRPRSGSSQRSPRPPSWILGVLLLRGGRGGKGGGSGEGSVGEGGKTLWICSPGKNFLATPLPVSSVRYESMCVGVVHRPRDSKRRSINLISTNECNTLNSAVCTSSSTQTYSGCKCCSFSVEQHLESEVPECFD